MPPVFCHFFEKQNMKRVKAAGAAAVSAIFSASDIEDLMKRIFYMPLTAAPYKQNKTYTEIQPQSPQLAGIIRCFWGSKRPYLETESYFSETIVIPDTCVDIIYQIDYTENTITGTFCGINDASFVAFEKTKPGHLISVFAIRFYAWSVFGVSEDSLKGTINGCYDVQSRFYWFDKVLRQQLFEKTSLEERRSLTEELFLKKLASPRENPTIHHAVSLILMEKGVLTADKLAKECFLSSRQMERLFHEYIGITPKKLCGLVRYQCLWNEILQNPSFSILDGVCRYGFTDQSHLMREFKRYHTMDIQRAVRYACDNVENIQYFSGRL